MPIRYYPSFAIIENLNSSGEFTLKGLPYSGKYYETFNGRYFSGPNPEVGPSDELQINPNYIYAPGLNSKNFTEAQKRNLAVIGNLKSNRIPGKPNSYFPQPSENDYKRGYLIRYFTKKENERGFVIEISEDEYNSIVNGTADYDVSMYQTTKILWKITGPLRSQRKSQYDVTAGIIDTNQRLTEAANKTFLGIVDFIGGDYTKFARPTA